MKTKEQQFLDYATDCFNNNKTPMSFQEWEATNYSNNPGDLKPKNEKYNPVSDLIKAAEKMNKKWEVFVLGDIGTPVRIKGVTRNKENKTLTILF